MKVSYTEEEFKPMDIQISLQSADELRLLWHIANVPWGRLKQMSVNKTVDFPRKINQAILQKFWKDIDTLCRAKGLRLE